MAHLKSSILMIVCLVFSVASEPTIIIDNPYAGILWSGAGAWQRHKANFHTHTTQSDGAMAPNVVIDLYHEKGYTILAITDHNRNTWPWTNWDRDPAELGMLAISGNEFSSGHHRGSLFNTIDGNPGSNVKATLNQIADSGGLSMLYHPGRYSESIDWYVDIYKTIPTCIGMEVFNQNDRYPNDRATWDSVLTRLMPDRPVWGYANDDMHTTSHLFRGYNIIFVEELTESNVRQALQLGRSYFSYEPGRTGNALAPSIDSITLDTIAMTITVFAKNHNEIQWISSGIIVGNDSVFSYAQSHQLPYVRARIIGSKGETHTQPFGIRTHLELDTALLVDTGDVWSYLDDGSDQGELWRELDFNDAAWASGPAKLGYGNGNESTIVNFGNNSSYKHITTYFRKEFIFEDGASIQSLALSLLKDDGAVVYLNGIEVHRSNMPDGIISYNTFASSCISGVAESTYEQAYIPDSLIIVGRNVVAVEVHQCSRTSSDLAFDMSLTALISENKPIDIPIDTGHTEPSDDEGVVDVPTDSTSTYLKQSSLQEANHLFKHQQNIGEDIELIAQYISEELILLSIKPNILMNQLKIIDITGRTIQQIDISSNEHLVDVSSFGRGIYILKAYSLGWSGSLVIRID
jgi:hypothetical protein